MEIHDIFDAAKKYKFDEIVVKKINSSITQIKFSNNQIDISNGWNEENYEIFVSRGKRIYSFDLKNQLELKKSLQIADRYVNLLEENPDFESINTKKYSYRKRINRTERINDVDPSEYVKDFVDEYAKYVRRLGGIFYKKQTSLEVLTNYNYFYDSNQGIEFNVRAFDHNDVPTQQSFATSSDDDLDHLYEIGNELMDHLRMIKSPKEGEDGKYPVVLHPLFFASIVSYTIPMASAYQVDSGISLFAGRMNQKIGSTLFTMYDDATDDGMYGSRIADDEGVPTKKTPIIEKGKVKNYLHNSSTAKKYNAETTGNAGIVAPTPWQVSVEPGNEDPIEMIQSIRDGLYIVNTWYTRFQDYREGIFSTIPRDGIYRIKNGEVVENWRGIRVSDSLINIFKNIEGLSKSTKKIKWWDETMYSKVPYVYVAGIKITKSK